jgi:hypothetical protein
MVYNGKPTRQWLSKEEAASPTASLEGILLTSIVDVKENRDVMSADIPNAFIQAHLPATEDGDERVIMKITGVLVDLLVSIDPTKYGPFVVTEKGTKTLYVEVLKALYGMLVEAQVWYRQLKSHLEDTGFKFNPYDTCIANRKVNGSTHTIKFHVDDIMSSHRDPNVNDNFLSWLNNKHGIHGEVKATRGKKHDYLGMTFIFGDDGLIVDMKDYTTTMLTDFPFALDNKTAPTPAARRRRLVSNSGLPTQARLTRSQYKIRALSSLRHHCTFIGRNFVCYLFILIVPLIRDPSRVVNAGCVLVPTQPRHIDPFILFICKRRWNGANADLG